MQDIVAKMKTLLIIGGTGLLSGAVAKEAVNKGFDVTCINRGLHNPVAGTKVIVSDKDDYAKLKNELNGCFFDSVIDFLVRKDDELQRSFEFYSAYTNQYLFVSSTMIFNSSIDLIFEEDSPKVQEEWPYSKEKWECEKLLVELSKDSECHYTIIRPGITYDDTRIPYSVMPIYGQHWSLIARMLEGKPIVAINAGMNKCNIMRVEDFAIGVVGLFGNKKAYDEAFNVCGDESPSFCQVLDEVANIVGTKYQILGVSAQEYTKLVPNRKDEIIGRSFNYVCNNKKLKRIVPDFGSHISLHDGLSQVLKAYKENNYYNGIDYAWDAECDKVAREKGWNTSHFIDYLHDASIQDKLVYHKIMGNRYLYFYYRSLKKMCAILGF